MQFVCYKPAEWGILNINTNNQYFGNFIWKVQFGELISPVNIGSATIQNPLSAKFTIMDVTCKTLYTINVEAGYPGSEDICPVTHNVHGTLAIKGTGIFDVSGNSRLIFHNVPG